MPETFIYPYQYHAYDLDILSEIPVTGFETATVKEADVIIRLGEVPESLPDVVNKGVLFESTRTEFLLKVDPVARYFVRNGKEIKVQLLGNALPGEVSAFISGSAFGALLLQRHMLPIHASTVIYKENCLVFAGISGAGKSTLAAALIREGGTLVADDISVIDFSGDRPSVCPSFPTIKIWEDSLKHLDIPLQGLDPVRGEMRKFYLPVATFTRTFTGIHHIFILSAHNKSDLDIKEIQGLEKFRLLKKHTYLFRGIPNTGLEQNHFMLVNRLATAVPVTKITRPNADLNTGRLVRWLGEFLSKG